MCWEGRITDKKVAEKDITVKKILDSVCPGLFIKSRYFAPYYKDFEYEIGKVYETEITPVEYEDRKGWCSISEGFHSYSMKLKISKSCQGRDVYIISPNGRILNFLFGISPMAVMECVIPKSTVYWENDLGEIVSEKLIVKKEL